MRDIADRLKPIELESHRDLETDLRILDSGAVEMTMDDARRIVNAHRTWWIQFFAERPYLEDEEFYEVDTVRGIVFVDKE